MKHAKKATSRQLDNGYQRAGVTQPPIRMILFNTVDTVVLFYGAHVPYACTPLEIVQGRRERDIQEALDKNQAKYNKTLETLQPFYII